MQTTSTYGVAGSSFIVTPDGLKRVCNVGTSAESHVGRGIHPNTVVKSIGTQEARRVILLSGASLVVPKSAVCGPIGALSVGDTMQRVIGPYYPGELACNDTQVRKFIQSLLPITLCKGQSVKVHLTNVVGMRYMAEASDILAWLFATGFDAQLEYYGNGLILTYWPAERGLVEDTVAEIVECVMQPMYTISSTAGDEASVNGVLVRTN